MDDYWRNGKHPCRIAYTALRKARDELKRLHDVHKRYAGCIGEPDLTVIKACERAMKALDPPKL